MAAKCQVTGQGRQVGHRVSHANNKTKHVFRPNLQVKKVYLASEKRWVKLRMSTRAFRTIDKIGLEETIRKYGLSL